MTDTRKKNVCWRIDTNTDGTTPHRDAALAVMMDIRDELQAIRRQVECPNVRMGFIAMQQLMRHIAKHGAKPKPAPKPRKPR